MKPFTDEERATLNALLLRAAGADGGERDDEALGHLTELASDPDAFRAAVAGFEPESPAK